MARGDLILPSTLGIGFGRWSMVEKLDLHRDWSKRLDPVRLFRLHKAWIVGSQNTNGVRFNQPDLALQNADNSPHTRLSAMLSSQRGGQCAFVKDGRDTIWLRHAASFIPPL